MLRHILVPLDGSSLSEQALNYATEVVAQSGRIILLSVVEVPTEYEYALVDIPMTAVTARQITDEEVRVAHQRVRDYLENKARLLIEKGYHVDCVIETGDPASVINDVANANHVDAIVMTTHGRTGLNRWIFGSVTQKVISQMHCPVMVIPGTQPVKVKEDVDVKRSVPVSS